jgi:hypothetical protein
MTPQDIRDVMAALRVVRERLELNNYDGEEDVFIEDCDDALEIMQKYVQNK